MVHSPQIKKKPAQLVPQKEFSLDFWQAVKVEYGCTLTNNKERRKLANWSLGTSSAAVENEPNDKKHQEEVYEDFWQKIEIDRKCWVF
ncbi:hypothetical protein L5515_012461 [Caenorhabditis briggsae]|uniref:Uncharacterized protein n=1 Tax=Caenorhabditis briggsae TaxID=6238 RepID=A0AAE9JHV6_CAEBR|nr:hypothetical protein L5515_012461 [Caenorhabditis briggsae]